MERAPMLTPDHAEPIVTQGMRLHQNRNDARCWAIKDRYYPRFGPNSRLWQEWVQLAEKILERERALRRERDPGETADDE